MALAAGALFCFYIPNCLSYPGETSCKPSPPAEPSVKTNRYTKRSVKYNLQDYCLNYCTIVYEREINIFTRLSVDDHDMWLGPRDRRDHFGTGINERLQGLGQL